MDSGLQSAFSGINEIRDRALLLSFGNEYLYKKPFLKKVGISIALKANELQDTLDIHRVRLSGQAQKESDRLLEGINTIASLLLDPGGQIKDKGTIGQLGRDLESQINSFSRVVKTLRVQVEGTSVYTDTDTIKVPVQEPPPTYQRPRPQLSLFGWVGPLFNFIAALVTFVLKTTLLLVLISMFPLGYLYLTMDTEKALLAEVNKSSAFIESQYELITRLNDNKTQLARKIAALEEMNPDDLSRQDKIEVMDLNLSVHQLSEQTYKAEFEVSVHEKKLENITARLAEIKRKTFVERLLRFD